MDLVHQPTPLANLDIMSKTLILKPLINYLLAKKWQILFLSTFVLAISSIAFFGYVQENARRLEKEKQDKLFFEKLAEKKRKREQSAKLTANGKHVFEKLKKSVCDDQDLCWERIPGGQTYFTTKFRKKFIQDWGTMMPNPIKIITLPAADWNRLTSQEKLDLGNYLKLMTIVDRVYIGTPTWSTLFKNHRTMKLEDTVWKR